MNVDLTKTSHVVFFAAFLPAVSLLIGYGVSLLLPNLPFWVETISPLGAYGLLYAAFDRYLWSLRIFTWLGIVRVPNISGRWYGEQLSSFKNADGKPVKSRVILEVEQTFSTIRACSYYKRWQSNCTSMMVEMDGTPQLVMLFQSEPNAYHDGEDGGNKGVARLRYLENEDIMIGEYYNTGGRSGQISLKRSTKPLLHRFEA